MSHHGALRRIAVGMLVLPLLAACDGGNPQRNQSPTAASPSSSPSPTASSPTPSPTPTASLTEMTLKMSQKKFVSYYEDYIESARSPSSGKPPPNLITQTVSDSPERDWLRNSFAEGGQTGGHIVSGDVKISVGPEVAANGSRTHVKFRACVDPHNVKIKVGGEIRKPPWQLLIVEMRAKPGASRSEIGKSSSAWLIYSKEAISDKKCGY